MLLLFPEIYAFLTIENHYLVMVKLFLLILFGMVYTTSSAQVECTNKLGAWIWYVELTGMDTHEEVADSLSSVGIKRVYTKVADGSVDSTWWTEIVDRDLIQSYHEQDMEIWAWSYNYPENDEAQAEALYLAAKTGYDGYVIDVESPFDGKAEPLSSLFVAFHNARQKAIADGYITDDFKIYCTTWGNPDDHNFRIDLIDPWVDGYMPQTYVEIWSGGSLIDELEFWIDVGTQEYIELGATKPIHHMTATENNIMTGDELNRFMKVAGPEFSIWRVPGGGTPNEIWDDWNEIEWDYDFCPSTSTTELISNTYSTVYPTLTTGNVIIESIIPIDRILLLDMWGRILNTSLDQADFSTLPSGQYILQLYLQNQTVETHKVIKI